jgi:hypothetical protein
LNEFHSFESAIGDSYIHHWLKLEKGDGEKLMYMTSIKKKPFPGNIRLGSRKNLCCACPSDNPLTPEILKKEKHEENQSRTHT